MTPRDKLKMSRSQCKVVGRAVLDLDQGYLAEVKMRLSSETEFDIGVQAILAEDIEVTRTPGNPLAIAIPVPPKNLDPPPLTKGKVILNLNSMLTLKDIFDSEKKGCRCKIHEVNLQAGKTYVIDMKKTPDSTLDTYLKLIDPTGKKVAEDDDSGGDLNARIVYRATMTGRFQIIATTFHPNDTGAYQLTVTQADP